MPTTHTPDLNPAPRSGIGRRILLVGLSVLVSAALSEALLRALWTNPYASEVPDRIVHLRIQHALRNFPIDRSQIVPESPTVPLRTDERSYILPSFRFENPDWTIAFLGGSTTECAAVSEEIRFPALVSTLLEQRGLRVNSLNAGLSGNTTHDAINILLNHVVEDQPDVVVIMEAWNDVGVLSQDPIYRSRSGYPLGVGTAARWALQAASARLSLFGAVRSYTTTPGIQPRAFEGGADPKREQVPVPVEPYIRRLRGLVRLARALEIVPVLMTQPSVGVRTALTPGWIDTGNQATFNEAMRSVASEEGVALIDLAHHVEHDVEGWNQPMKVFYDGVHVNDDGSRIYARYITERLIETVLADSRPLGDHDEEAPLAAPPQDRSGLDH